MFKVGRPSLYAAASDFVRIFHEERDRLYRLSLLLTAHEEKAERCFIAAFDECAEMRFIFQDYAQTWVRRSIISNAIPLTNPCDAQEPGHEIRAPWNLRTSARDSNLVIGSVLALDHLQRLVLVMSSCERCSDQECSILLRRSRREVREARAEALQHIEQTCGIEEKTCSTLLRAWIALDCDVSRSFVTTGSIGSNWPRTGSDRLPSKEGCS